MSEVKDAVGKDVLDALQFLDNSIEEMFLDVEAKNTKDTNGIFPPGHSTKSHSTESEHHVSSPAKKPQLTGIQELQVGGKSQTIQINPELERKLKLKKPATELDLPLSEPSLTGLRQGPPTYPKPRFTSRPKSMVEIPPSYPVRELRANIDQKLNSLQHGFHKQDGSHTVDEPIPTTAYHTKPLDNLSSKQKSTPRELPRGPINAVHIHQKPTSKLGSKMPSSTQSNSVSQDLPLISTSPSIGLQKRNDIIISPLPSIWPPSQNTSQPGIQEKFPQSQTLNGPQDKYFRLPRASLGERNLLQELAPAQSFSLPRNFGVAHPDTQRDQPHNGKYQHASLKMPLLQTNVNMPRNRSSSSATELSVAMSKFPAPPPHTALFLSTDSSCSSFSLPRAQTSISSPSSFSHHLQTSTSTTTISSPHLQTSTTTHSSFSSHHLQTSSTSPRNYFSSSHVQNPNCSSSSSGNLHSFQETPSSVVAPVSRQNRERTITSPFSNVRVCATKESQGQRVPNRVQMRPQNTSDENHREALKKLGLFKM